MSKFERLSHSIWIMHAEHETDRPILACIVGADRTLLIDAGNSPAHATAFIEDLKRQGIRLPEMMILTHWHWDHTFGCMMWNIPIIAHKQTAQALQKLAEFDLSDEGLVEMIDAGMADDTTATHMKLEYGKEREIQIVQPNILFEDQLTIDLGGVTCEVYHVGGDHSDDSCVIYIKEEKTLFLGDALGPAIYGGPRRYTSSSFLRLMEAIYQFDAVVYVESHGKPMKKKWFHKELADWVQLARYVEGYGGNRKKLETEFRQFLKVDSLSQDWIKALDWFTTE